ncbi:MAG: putative bifunctional diguanylate cyclase/phosphodiesterase [Acidiferrobacterales bacterium]
MGEDELATHGPTVQPRGALTVERVVEKLPRIRAFVLLRYTLIIAMAYLLLVEHEFSSPPTGLILLIVAALASNVLVARLPAHITNSTVFNASIIVGDTIWITAALLYTGLFSAEFFYLYFFVLLLAAIGENLGLIAVGALAVCTAYIFVLSASGDASLVWSSPSLIRIPFLFTAAAFYGYLIDRVRHEQRRAREEAHANKELGHEIAERKRIEQALQAAKDYADNLITSSIDMIVSVDVNRNIVEFNPAAEKAFGYGKAEVLGKPVDLLYADQSEGVQRHANTLDGGFTGEVVNKRKNGEIFYSYVSASVMHDATGRVVGVMGTSRDITERKRAEEIIVHQAYHDVLTNLPNRRLFVDRLTQGLARHYWHKRLVAVLFLDLDHFKRINDTLGHNVGDLLLKAVAERLTACVREGDTVARLGGDEFAINLADVAQANDVPKVAHKIIDTLSKPYVLEGHELFITTSMGISIYPDDAQDPETLLKTADIAMYRAKEHGRNNYQHYSPDMNVQASERLAMENSLRHALEREEFLLEYQPQVDIKTGRIIGNEALVRWQHPDLGMILPGKFIPLAEESGLIVPIGEWVLRTACAQNKAWQAAGLPPIPVAVNVSARQLRHENLLQTVDRTLQETGLNPNYLELELTESIMQEPKEAIRLLSKLNTIGVQIAIDDFGTGYSSLNYLKRFPINKLKIDQSFVRDITNDPDDRAIVAAIITLAHSLNLKTIAEGVETQEQMAYLRSLECDEAQGNLLRPPLPAEHASKLLAENRT